MDIQFERLKQRAEILGNHYNRYLNKIEKTYGKLESRLEQAGYYEDIHVWKAARNIEEEMAIISALSDEKAEKYELMGCFFALQYLQLCLNAYDTLYLDITRGENKDPIFRNFMLTVGAEFRALSAAYMRQLLLMELDESDLQHVVFLGVGTRSDQDDIDIGAVDDDNIDRDRLNRAIAKMNSQMFKNATTLHYHLSEHVGSSYSFSASLQEYNNLLNYAIHDFVIINEMLGAAHIIGSKQIFRQFKHKITSRYYFSKRHDIKYHEGYLRGIIGEARSFMFRELSNQQLIPKIDALRMIKLCLFAAKTMYQIRQVNAWKILDDLIEKEREEEHRQLWENLEKQLNFFEIFRYLYQMLVVQEEEINVNIKGSAQDLTKVAKAMGYKRIGTASAADFLLTDYYDNVIQAKKTVKALLPAAIEHLQSVTSFNKTLKYAENINRETPGNFTDQFVKSSRFFWGTRFWDDILHILEKDNAALLIELIKDFETHPQGKKEELLKGFRQWAGNSYITMFQLIIMLYNHRHKLPNPNAYQEFNDYLVDHIQNEPDQAQRISTIFNHYPKMVYDYISLLKPDQLNTFGEWLKSDIWSPELEPVRERLNNLLKLKKSSSRYFQLRLSRLAANNPKLIHYIKDNFRLTAMSKGIWAEVERELILSERQKHLIHYMDVEFVRVGMQSMSGLPAKNVAYQFAEFSINFINMAFDLAKQQVDEAMSHKIKTKDTFGVFISGGLGQMQAFVDDFDLLILLNSNDPEMLDYCTRICSKANSIISKGGILPHYCLSESTGEFVTTFEGLKRLLSSTTEPHFLEQSQLVCSKLVYGSKVLQQDFDTEILQPFIFSQSKKFAKEMLIEIKARQSHHDKPDKHLENLVINVKEDPGGLRDTEMLLITLRALHEEILENSNYIFLSKLIEKLPKYEKEFTSLNRSYEYLRKVRNLTRLTVAADDNVTLDSIGHFSSYLKSKSKEGSIPQYYLKRIVKTMQYSQKAIDSIIKNYILQLLED